MTLKNMEEYLRPTYYIDAESKLIVNLANELVTKQRDAVEKAKSIFYWTRDKISYDPYSFSTAKVDFKASRIVKRARGWCVQKAVVLAALSRAVGIPSRLHFADIKNYQITPKLKKEMGTDLFIFHGYTELYLNKWVKATPAFNIELCQKFGHKTVEFDGLDDAILPSTTLKGERHIEYLKDRGPYADLPFEEILDIFKEVYSFVGTRI
ncbi:MAG TPA: transglutaminase family protein [Candidatus Deferrimicrobium sp.]|nr:transglutaminase family protein [Candidatus Deferrimicrobium sp.]